MLLLTGWDLRRIDDLVLTVLVNLLVQEVVPVLVDISVGNCVLQ